MCLATLATLCACAALAPCAPAETSATIIPRLYPDRLGARTVLALTVQFSANGTRVPAPVRRSVLRFPAGMTLEVPHLRGCSLSRVRVHGADACPADSVLGRGHALIEAPLGSQTIAESVSLRVFLGPLRNLQPVIIVVGQGDTPLDERSVLDGTMLPVGAPFGEALTLMVPPIPTLALEPNASLVTLSLVIGSPARRATGSANTLRLPATCPVGGFPFAAEFTYADNSAGSSSATVPCPR